MPLKGQTATTQMQRVTERLIVHRMLHQSDCQPAGLPSHKPPAVIVKLFKVHADEGVIEKQSFHQL